MRDDEIVALYWAREEQAIAESDAAYGAYLHTVAGRVLSDREDCAECVSDTYWRAWETMPPHRPGVLRTYLGKLTRGLAIDRWRRQTSRKREGSRFALPLDELSECVAGGDEPDRALERADLGAAVAAYLRTLKPEARTLFVGRYYFLDSIRELARSHGMTEALNDLPDDLIEEAERARSTKRAHPVRRWAGGLAACLCLAAVWQFRPQPVELPPAPTGTPDQTQAPTPTPPPARPTPWHGVPGPDGLPLLPMEEWGAATAMREWTGTTSARAPMPTPGAKIPLPRPCRCFGTTRSWILPGRPTG